MFVVKSLLVSGEVAIVARDTRKKNPSTIQDSVWLAVPETKQCDSWIEAAGIVEVVITIL